MTAIRAFIADDERLAREELRTLLADFPQIEITGEAANATEALARVPPLKPDLLFLDIEMPGCNGFQLLEKLPPPLPHVIFTTAYDKFAVDAFEINALDYLLKPVHPERLALALARVPPGETVAGTPREDEASHEPPDAPLRETDNVFVRDGDRCWFIPVRSIHLLEAEGNHTRVHFQNCRPLLYRALVALEARLPGTLFVRANRSQMVNTSFIQSVEPWFSGTLKITLQNGTAVEFSRRQTQVFRDRLAL